jgi:GLPGLI family protein
MKQLFIIFFTLSTYVAFAQSLSGTIYYTEEVKFQIDLPKEHAEMLKNMPTSQSSTKRLDFSENVSVYKNDKAAEDLSGESESGGAQIKMVLKRPESYIYCDLNKNEVLQSEEFFGKQFLINDKLDVKQWKMTSEQQIISDYPCIKATAETDGKTIIAWYTPKLKLQNGPDGLAGLPGAILRVEMNDGKRTVTATKIDLKPIDKSTLLKPTKGKEVSRDEFKKIRDEKLKEMGATSGSGAKIIIREERN